MKSPLANPLLIVCSAWLAASSATGQTTQIVTNVEPQPLMAQADRVLAALDHLGSPANPEVKAAVNKARTEADGQTAVAQLQKAMDSLCLLVVQINPESRVQVRLGTARPELVEQGWRSFLIKVDNEAGVTAPLKADSANARPLAGSPPAEVADRWLDVHMFGQQPLEPTLSGLKVEYRIAELYSRDAGKREATLSFNVGQG